MNAFQPTLATCPWLPIIGNHEGNDGDNYMRYLNMTFGEQLGGEELLGFDRVTSTSSRPLTELLSDVTGAAGTWDGGPLD